MGKVIYLKNINKIGGRFMSVSSAVLCPPKDIEYLAHEVLQSYDIDTVPVDPIAIAKNLGIKVYSSSFNSYRGDTVLGAITIHEDGQGEIIVNKNNNYKRQRFTVAHELGHYFMHRVNNSNYEVVDMHISSGYCTNDPEEIQANDFAAALLMDKYMIYENLEIIKKLNFSKYQSIRYLADKFKVSNQAMEYRLKKLGLI